jgi:hypothetical protein
MLGCWQRGLVNFEVLTAVTLMIHALWDVTLSRPGRVAPVLSKNRCALYCLTLKMEALRSKETSVISLPATQSYVPKYRLSNTDWDYRPIKILFSCSEPLFSEWPCRTPSIFVIIGCWGSGGLLSTGVKPEREANESCTMRFICVLMPEQSFWRNGAVLSRTDAS